MSTKSSLALLAIQSVDNGDSHGIRSPIQTASYMSIASSIGSIIAGLLLIRQNRSKGPATPLRLLSNRSFNLQLMALTYSLPWNFLMLSILSFLLYFGFPCFSSDPFTCLIVGVLCFCVATSLISYAWRCRESHSIFNKPSRSNPPKELTTSEQQAAEHGDNQSVCCHTPRMVLEMVYDALVEESFREFRRDDCLMGT
ncbi:hypothetical protein BDN71DRAFT_484852 [Pleurotus eryngii]|uniref:Uncharacterized protein n=1 Tax=Pleurotus eryngii TaxID=5323 RepID=A0A9P6DL35_PLEER|nr:hypothetical protein BDN71DRAFT_484852 [Pleurotus eryngii]